MPCVAARYLHRTFNAVHNVIQRMRMQLSLCFYKVRMHGIFASRQHFKSMFGSVAPQETFGTSCMIFEIVTLTELLLQL